MVHFDLLRIFAAFSVVMLHSAAQFWYTLDISSTDWRIANSYDALFRFGVPIFVMISGALFLDPAYQLDIRKLIRHNIFRMVILYIVWSCLYGIYDSINFGLGPADYKDILREMLAGRYHLWFLPMITGIYVLLPVLKSWVTHAQKENIVYFLLLFFLLQVCSETIRALSVSDEISGILDRAKVEMACSYIGYFIWGYYLAHVGIGRNLCRLFGSLAVPAALCNIFLGNYLAKRAGVPVGSIYDSFGLFTFIIASALFLYTVRFLGRHSFSQKSAAVIREVSVCTLGVYVMHIGVMEISLSYGIHCMRIPNIFGIPLYALGCFVFCTLLAAGLRRIPVIGKYLC